MGWEVREGGPRRRSSETPLRLKNRAYFGKRFGNGWVARPVYTKTTIIRAQLFVRYSQASVEGGGSGRIGTFSKRLIGRRLYVFQPTGHLAHGTRATPGDRLASSAPLPDRGQHVEISVGSEPPPLSPRNGLVSSRCAPCGVAVSITQNMMQVWGGWVGG